MHIAHGRSADIQGARHDPVAFRTYKACLEYRGESSSSHLLTTSLLVRIAHITGHSMPFVHVELPSIQATPKTIQPARGFSLGGALTHCLKRSGCGWS